MEDLAFSPSGGSASSDAGSSLTSDDRDRPLLLVARGASSAAIGEALHLSPKTVDTYRSRLMAKLGLTDIAAVVRWAIREGLLDAAED